MLRLLLLVSDETVDAGHDVAPQRFGHTLHVVRLRFSLIQALEKREEKGEFGKGELTCPCATTPLILRATRSPVFSCVGPAVVGMVVVLEVWVEGMDEFVV
jgi:hypothetical protein